MSGALGLLTRFGLSEGRSEPPPPVGSPLVVSFSGASQSNDTLQGGWEFRVGANPLTVTELRLNITNTDEEIVRVWRLSDQALLASAAITPLTSGAWYSAALGAPVVLAANTNYAITTRRASGARRTQRVVPLGNLVVDTARITRVQGRYALDNNFPGFTDANYAYGLPDLLAG